MGGFHHLEVPEDSVKIQAEELARLPPSALPVYRAILRRGPLSHEQLRMYTGMPARTIRYAIRRMKDNKILDSRMALHDSRVCYFFIHPSRISDDHRERSQQEAEAEGGYVMHVESQRSF